MTLDHTTINARIGGLETQVKALVEAVNKLTVEVGELKTDVKEMREIVEAWKSVRWFGGMVQSMSKVIVAMGAIGAVIWAAIKLAVAGALK
jgi:outer membrane murein-binding lipoprotein Lpp